METAEAGFNATGVDPGGFNATLAGRINLTDAVARFVVEPDDGPDPFEPGQSYLCGNPEMIASSQLILGGRGFGPEGIRAEQYWAAGRPRATEAAAA